MLPMRPFAARRALSQAALSLVFLLAACSEQPSAPTRVVSSAATAPVEFGARVPFVTCEAEDPANRTTGTVHLMTTPVEPSPEREASGYGYVELAQTGQYVEFAGLPAANGIVVRHCIPDAPEGDGQSATLGLYINDERRLSLTLSSHHNWLYGKTGNPGENGQSNQPTDHPHVFWDESRFIVPGGIKPGDRVRVQKDTGDTAAFYRIDLLDAEQVPLPRERPAGALSIGDFGANGQDAATDTAAIRACLAAAKERHVAVWLPPGRFLVNGSLGVDGVVVQGAGMWHTTVEFTERPKRWAGVFSLAGDGAQVADLTIEGPSTARTEPLHGFTGQPHHWSIRRVWITHTNTAFWMSGEDGVIAECRVRFTYADGINLNNGKSGYLRRVLVEDNHARGCGDDSMAILCSMPVDGQRPEDHASEQVTLRHNTTIAPWWASNCDLAGGSGHVIEDNLFEGTGLVVNLPGAYPMQPQGAAIIRHNLLRRCGSDYRTQRRGALWIYPGSTTISGLVVADNRIIAPLFTGIDLQGTQHQDCEFRDNLITSPGEDAIRIGAKVSGSARFSGTRIEGLPEKGQAIRNLATTPFQVLLSADGKP